MYDALNHGRMEAGRWQWTQAAPPRPAATDGRLVPAVAGCRRRQGDADILIAFGNGYVAPRMAHLPHGLPVEVLGRLHSDRVMRKPVPMPWTSPPQDGRRPGPGRPLGSDNRRPATRYAVGENAERPEPIAERGQVQTLTNKRTEGGRQTSTRCSDTDTPRHQQYLRSDTVAPELDQEMSVAPSIALRQGERGHVAEGPFAEGVRSAYRTPFRRRMAM
jgi:hypothetical protein